MGLFTIWQNFYLLWQIDDVVGQILIAEKGQIFQKWASGHIAGNICPYEVYHFIKAPWLWNESLDLHNLKIMRTSNAKKFLH